MTKKKATITVKKVKLRKVEPLGEGKTRVIADDVELEVNNAPPLPPDPIPDEPIVFDDHAIVDAVEATKHPWRDFFRSFWG